MIDRLALIKTLIVPDTASVREAMQVIDGGARQIALVVDTEGRLVAVVTDGDIRRRLLSGVGLDAPVAEVMRKDFSAVPSTKGVEAARQLMQARKLHQIPVVDEGGRPVDLVHIDDFTGITKRDTRIVLMAGGLGSRLRPLTETTPKPMLPIEGRPILEVIIRRLINQGYYDFTIALNYKGDMIRDHFRDGSIFGARIGYVQEDKRMGTAGALSLLAERPTSPFVVMNSDLLTSLRFDALLRFHEETGAVATMCGREYSMQVPYGVIEMEGTALKGIIEKPTHSHFINAGIYVLSPEVLDYVEPDNWLDMPTLFERVIEDGKTASVFPVQEYWIDIGRIQDLERACADTRFKG